MKLERRTIAVVAAATVGAAGLTAGAFAATSGSSDDAGDLADAINKRAGTSITADDVTGAYEDVLKGNLDEAVAAGRITQAQADQILARAKDAPGLGFGGFHMRGGPFGGPHGAVTEAVAKKLGLTEAQLRTRIRNGRTLTAIAKAEGVSRADLIATITTTLKAEGVPAADVADLAAHIADETRGRGPRGGRGFGGWRP